MKTPAPEVFRPIIVAAWFGPLPSYLPLWAASCAANPTYTWRLLTDQVKASTEFAPGVVAVPFTMEEFARRTQAATGVTPAMIRAYKVCDLRPLFGEILADYFQGYTHWGHCDLDMLFGNLAAFLPPEVFVANDRVMARGHFSVYRNTVAINHAYRIQTKDSPAFEAVLRTPEACVFDEWNGIHRKLAAMGAKQYLPEIIADFDPNVHQLRLTRHPNESDQAFLWKPGEAMKINRWTGAVRQRFAYLHFQKRAMPLRGSSTFLAKEGCVVSPRGFWPIPDYPVNLLTGWKLSRPPFNWKRMRTGLSRLKAKIVR